MNNQAKVFNELGKMREMEEMFNDGEMEFDFDYKLIDMLYESMSQIENMLGEV